RVPRLALLEGAVPGTPRLDLADLATFRGASPPEGFRRAGVCSDAVAMIIYTSGSTSRPKGAMMAHGNYLAKYHELRMLDARLGPQTRSLMPFGLHSSPGLPWGILFTTTLGGTLYFTRKYKAERTLRTLVEQRIDFFLGVPMVFDQVSLLPGFAAADLSALTFARMGGASASRETLMRWSRKGVTVRQLYGMTEMGGGAIIATEEEASAHPDSCGRGLPFTRMRIVDHAGEERAPGEPGHVLLRGPGMMAGYWRDPAATNAALVDGWMHTGDIGSVDKDGYFRFVDRAKEMIKSGGYNVSPAEIEAVLMDHAGVLEAAAFAVTDDRFGEAACACVFGTPPLDAKALFAHCAARLAGFKLPRYIVVLDAPLPRLANEKVDRRCLKRDHADVARRQERLSASA
ncbi:MAG: long-chain fatty acid--CoA ligase, partial [Sphingomonadales bacterium]